MAPRPLDALICSEVCPLIEEHLDGELSAELESRVTAHLDRCDDCSAELERARHIRNELRQLPQFDAPRSVIDAAIGTVSTTKTGPLTSTRRSRVSGPAFAALAAAVIAFGVAAVLLTPGRLRLPPTESDSANRASAEAKLAFALIADATRRGERELMDSALTERVLGTAIRSITRTIRITTDGGVQPIASPTKKPKLKQRGLP